MGMGPWALQAAMEWAKELGLSGGRAKRPKKKSTACITFDLIPYHHLQKDPQKKKKKKSEGAQLSCLHGSPVTSVHHPDNGIQLDGCDLATPLIDINTCH